MSGIAAVATSLRTQIIDHRVQLALSVRVTIAALASFALSQWLKVPLPLWTVLTAVILIQVSFGSSLKATIDYLIGTLGGAVYTGMLGALIPHSSDAALIGVLALAVAPLAFLAAINPSFRAAPFTGALVILVPDISHVGPIASAVYRVLEVAVGGGTALLVSLLVFPARAHSLAIAAAAKMLDLVSQCLPALFEGFVEARDTEAIRRLQDGIGQALIRLDAIAAEARHERIRFLDSEPDQGPLLRTMLRLRHDLVMIGRAAAEPLPEKFRTCLAPALAGVATATADYLRTSGKALLARSEPPPLATVGAALDDFATALATARRDGLTLGLPIDTLEHIFTLSFTLEQLHKNLVDLERCVRDSGRGK